MVAFSVYDTKPVHFISTAATSLKWVKKQRTVFDTRTNQSVKMEFLRTELQDKYNNGMNDVDISDQLRKIYCFNRWLRNRNGVGPSSCGDLECLLSTHMLLILQLICIFGRRSERTY